MNSHTLGALGRLGGAVDIALPSGAQWTWEDRFGAALVVLDIEQTDRLYQALAAACDDTWTSGSLRDCPMVIASLVEEMGGLREHQHLFSCSIDEHSFAYISSWPWSDRKHVSVRFGVHHIGGTQVDILTHKILIKRGLEIA
jgi:hypothetical protein